MAQGLVEAGRSDGTEDGGGQRKHGCVKEKRGGGWRVEPERIEPEDSQDKTQPRQDTAKAR
eukprot:371842-Rhodomonas_salina.5